MSDDILFDRENHLGIVTLNRQSALNALTLPMILALQVQLQAWQDDSDIHAVIVRAAEGKAFCAGGDVRWLYEAGRSESPEQMQFFSNEYGLNHFIHCFEKPYIALMDGVTMGGGVGISLHGSHPVATERFIFAMPETSIGFFPDIGASYLLSRTPGYFGSYLGLTGARLGAVDAYALGLVKQVISSDKLALVIDELIKADLSHDAHLGVSDCLQRFAMPVAAAPVMVHEDAINQCFNHVKVESIMGSLQETNDIWHQEILKALEQKAPLSLKVTHEQITRAKSLPMAECVKMDYCLVNHFMRDHDFYEGVRALLIDKDKSPHWQPNTLSQVTRDRVDGYFKCGEEMELNLF